MERPPRGRWCPVEGHTLHTNFSKLTSPPFPPPPATGADDEAWPTQSLHAHANGAASSARRTTFRRARRLQNPPRPPRPNVVWGRRHPLTRPRACPRPPTTLTRHLLADRGAPSRPSRRRGLSPGQAAVAGAHGGPWVGACHSLSPTPPHPHLVVPACCAVCVPSRCAATPHPTGPVEEHAAAGGGAPPPCAPGVAAGAAAALPRAPRRGAGGRGAGVDR